MADKTIDEEIAFYEKHFQHLEKNKENLPYSFVQEERAALINLIGSLELKRSLLADKN